MTFDTTINGSIAKKNSYTSKNITVRPVLKTRQLEKRNKRKRIVLRGKGN
jgi:hypothetical protein